MANRIQELILLLEQEIEQSPKQRLMGGNKRTVDCDRMLDLLGDLKVVVPEEVRVAQTLLMEQEAMLQDAEKQSMEIVAKARVESERLISRETVLREAKERADRIVHEAESKSDTLMRESRDYSQTVMEEVQRYLSRYIEMIDETREDIRRNYRGAPRRLFSKGEEELGEQPTAPPPAENGGQGTAGNAASSEGERPTQFSPSIRLSDVAKRQTVTLDDDIMRRLE